MMTRPLTVCLLILGAAGDAAGFEVGTHRVLTEHAFDRSRVADTLWLELDRDVNRAVPAHLLSTARSLRGWLEKGSVDEDANFSLAPVRGRHHFFDPHFNRPLSARVPGGWLPLGETAPDWALEDDRLYLTQSYSYRDALDGYVRALTQPTPSDREMALAQTFEILGHVVHVVQDMASPEHTRNDFHLPIGGRKSIFERHLDRPAVRGGLRFDGYEVPTFPTARDFWVSPTRDGTGLAEFSNRHFVTTDTNFSTSLPPVPGQYPRPVRDDSTAHEVDVRALSSVPLPDRWGRPLEGTLTFYGAPVVDTVTGEQGFNDRLTTLSYFDRDLEQEGAGLLFTINRFNVDRDADFLIPRAVGYSVGLLNHFFRGRLEPAFQDDPSDPHGAVLSALNRSSESIGPGTLSVYADDETGFRQPVGIPVSVAAPVAPGGALPPIALPGAFEAEAGAVVYRGVMGREADAVIGKAFGAAEVEEVFRGAADWTLRTPDGLYPLGLGLGPVDVRWGDRDNMLVTRTDEKSSGSVFKVYRINREEGARAVPLRADGTVDLVPVGATRIGADPILLGTTIDYRNITHFSQGLATVERHTTERRRADGRLESVVEIGPAAVETVVDRDYVLARTLSPVLAATPPSDDAYRWTISDFFLSRENEVYLLVQVVLGSGPGVRAPILRHSWEGELVPDPFDYVLIDQSAPPVASPVFVVNLSQRAVVAKSCEDAVRIVWEQTARANALEYHAVSESETSVVAGYAPVRIWAAAGPADPVLFDLESASGVSRITLEGLYRRELRDAGLLRFELLEGRSSGVLAIPDVVDGHRPAFRLTDRWYRPSPSPFVAAEVRRSSAADGSYALLGVQEEARESEPSLTRWRLLQWTPSREWAIDQAMPTPIGPRSFFSLAGAHRAATLAVESGRDPVDGRFKDRSHFLMLGAPVTFAGDLSARYELLQPALTYDVADGQFHRIGPALVALGLPRPLAATGPEAGVYHVLGRR